MKRDSLSSTALWTAGRCMHAKSNIALRITETDTFRRVYFPAIICSVAVVEVGRVPDITAKPRLVSIYTSIGHDLANLPGGNQTPPLVHLIRDVSAQNTLP